MSQFFSRCERIPEHLQSILDVISNNEGSISSDSMQLRSDDVLRAISKDLLSIGVRVEVSKNRTDLIKMPVLFGRNGQTSKTFSADAYDEMSKTVIEIEAGRAVTNYQFLKDLFEACVMQDVDYLVIAVRKDYRGSQNFEEVYNFMDTLYASGRLKLPLKGILIIGY